MIVRVVTNNNKIVLNNIPFCIGDYVMVTDAGCQYPTYHKAYRYFWGNNECVNLHESLKKGDNVWKIMNMAAHGNNYTKMLYHIRNRRGENAVIGGNGILNLKFHRKNRNHVHEVVIYQIPQYSEVVPHEWDDKLWDYYIDGEVVNNKKRKKHDLQFA